jgi:hypothetical protein
MYMGPKPAIIEYNSDACFYFEWFYSIVRLLEEEAKQIYVYAEFLSNVYPILSLVKAVESMDALLV